jgi:hypothetical protein
MVEDHSRSRFAQCELVGGTAPYADFFDAVSRARNEHKRLLIRLVVAGAKGVLPRPVDWKAAAWLLAKNFPLEYGDRPSPPLPAPAEEPKAAPLVMQLVLSTPDGTQRKTTFEAAEKIFCNFPRRDTYEPASPADDDSGNAANGSPDDPF